MSPYRMATDIMDLPPARICSRRSTRPRIASTAVHGQLPRLIQPVAELLEDRLRRAQVRRLSRACLQEADDQQQCRRADAYQARSNATFAREEVGYELERLAKEQAELSSPTTAHIRVFTLGGSGGRVPPPV
jgi:hypothetical protein